MKRLFLISAFLLFWPIAQVLPRTDPPSAAERLTQIQKKLSQFDPSMIPELLQKAAKDPVPAIRQVILVRLSRLDHAAVTEALERHAASDPDPQVALVSLERLRLQTARKLGTLFEKRLAMARTREGTPGIRLLDEQHQRWVTLSRGALLPCCPPSCKRPLR